MNRKTLAYIQLMRLDKPIGTLLLLWPTLWALWLSGKPTLEYFIIFTLGVIVMRAAGCVINDFADRNFDAHVERTRQRPLASGLISVPHALMTFAILIILAVCLLLLLPPLAWLMACFAFVTTVIYPFLKRFTHLPQFMLGIAFSWGIPMVYAASLGLFPLTCWLLFWANICWTIAYDTQYAMVDRNDDLKIGIKSTAILFGRLDKLIIAFLQLITLVTFTLIGLINQLNNFYFIAVGVAMLLFIYQQILIKDRERDKSFKAFLNNNYVGLVIFIGILLTTIV